jgi:hypothetical protein
MARHSRPPFGALPKRSRMTSAIWHHLRDEAGWSNLHAL